MHVTSFSPISGHTHTLLSLSLAGPLSLPARLPVALHAVQHTLTVLRAPDCQYFLFVNDDIIANRNEFPPRFEPVLAPAWGVLAGDWRVVLPASAACCPVLTRYAPVPRGRALGAQVPGQP